jgi:pimeloyl-ACP methyl ester carboxylesterase
VVNEIIRPPKLAYSEWDLPGDELFQNAATVRTDFKVTNRDGIQLSCSVFHQDGKLIEPRDFVVYCHTREGNRLQGLFLRHHFLPWANVVVFDFSGCGNSKADYVTLGITESNDIVVVMKHIWGNWKPKNVVLWGRSMGAVAAIQFALRPANQAYICCLVLDSPFINLNKLAEDIVKSRNYVPSFLIRCGICCVRQDLKKKTGADIGGIENLEAVKQIDVPTVYVSGKSDQVVLQKRVKALYAAHKCREKAFIGIDTDHASERSFPDMAKATDFVRKRLGEALAVKRPGLEFSTVTFGEQNK